MSYYYAGIAFKDIKSDVLYPTVGMKKAGEQIRVNFGQSPFVYDIDSMVLVSECRASNRSAD